MRRKKRNYTETTPLQSLGKGLLQVAVCLLACAGFVSACRESPSVQDVSSIHVQADSLKEAAFDAADSCHFAQCLTLMSDALDAYRQTKDTVSMSECLLEMCAMCHRLSDFSSALEYAEAAKEMAKAVGDNEKQAAAYHNMACIYMVLKQMDQARTFCRKAITMEEQLDQSDKLSVRYGVASEIYVKLDSLPQALSFAEHAYEIDREAADTVRMGRRLSQMADVYAAMGNTARAEELYKQSTQLLTAKGDRVSMCINQKQLGQLYQKTGRLAAADEAYQRCLAMGRSLRLRYVMQPVLEHLADLHQTTDPRRAMDYLRQAGLLKDSLYTEKTNQLSSSFAAKFENAEKEHTIEQQEAALRRHTFLFVIGLVIVVLLLALVVTLYYVLRLRTHSRDVLRQLNNVRSTFFTNITHEFRTPLTVINGLAEQLQRRHDALSRDEREQYLADIRRQGDTMLGLVNELLESSKMMLGQQQCFWMHGNVAAYVKMTVDSYREYVASLGLTLMFHPQQNDIEADFVGDYLSRILRNLISNSTKHTPRNGTITVGLRSEKQRLVIVVDDTGEGFPAQDLPHVFEMFYKGSSPKADASTGIGLNYVKQMVEQMGGTIVPENTAQGARMTLTLPLRQPEGTATEWDGQSMAAPMPLYAAPEEAAFPSDRRPSAAAGVQPTLLIVEDNADIAFYISTVMGNNYNTVFAADGSQALKKARETMPDIILTDVMMPHMDGFEFCRQVRNTELFSHIPIIIITAKAEERDRMEGLRAGADEVLVKPFNADELTLRVEKLLARRAHLRSKPGDAAADEADKAYESLKEAEREFVDRLTNLVSAHLNDRSLNADMLADLMHLTRTQLANKTRALTGSTVNNYITTMRMAHAKRMLTQTDLPIGDISVRCGFEDMGYFGRVFKQMFQCTPSQYRKRPH